jgi:regulator of cell morphogenesis and NO signaling
MKDVLDRKLADIVRDNYHTADVFEIKKIDFCCMGDRTLKEACEEAGIEFDSVLSELEDILTVQSYESRQFDLLPMDELCDYITEIHHHYARNKIPVIRSGLERILEVHGDDHPELREVYELFNKSCDTILAHMQKEETVLFPQIKRILEAYNRNQQNILGNNISIKYFINAMMVEHTNEGLYFKKIAILTHNYIVPPGECLSYEIAMKSLLEYEMDLHKHIHLENNILFPEVLKIESFLL